MQIDGKKRIKFFHKVAGPVRGAPPACRGPAGTPPAPAAARSSAAPAAAALCSELNIRVPLG